MSEHNSSASTGSTEPIIPLVSISLDNDNGNRTRQRDAADALFQVVGRLIESGGDESGSDAAATPAELGRVQASLLALFSSDEEAGERGRQDRHRVQFTRRLATALACGACGGRELVHSVAAVRARARVGRACRGKMRTLFPVSYGAVCCGCAETAAAADAAAAVAAAAAGSSSSAAAGSSSTAAAVVGSAAAESVESLIVGERRLDLVPARTGGTGPAWSVESLQRRRFAWSREKEPVRLAGLVLTAPAGRESEAEQQQSEEEQEEQRGETAAAAATAS